jgi:hypothetical protein
MTDVWVVTLSDPAQRRISGKIAGVGGRIALSNSIVFSAAKSFFGTADPMDGIRTATLEDVRTDPDKDNPQKARRFAFWDGALDKDDDDMESAGPP